MGVALSPWALLRSIAKEIVKRGDPGGGIISIFSKFCRGRRFKNYIQLH